MKKICLIAVLLVLINNNIFSQKTDRKLTFQSSPAFYVADIIMLGVFELSGNYKQSYVIMDLEAQYKINNLFNVSLAAAFITDNYSSSYYSSYYPSSYNERKEFQMIFLPMFIYRPLKTGLKGFYLGLNLPVGWNSYKNISKDEFSNINRKELGAIVGVGINIGYKWIFNNGFTLQIGNGIGKTWFLPKEGYYYNDMLRADGYIRLTNLDIHFLDLKFGYSF